MSKKVYEIIANEIIKGLEQGLIPWERPWHQGLCFNGESGRHYQGINQLLLGMKPYASNMWFSMKQINNHHLHHPNNHMDVDHLHHPNQNHLHNQNHN